MTPRPSAIVILPLLLPVGLLVGQEGVPPPPAPLHESLDAEGRPTHVVIRVVDGETLAPIPGAVLSLIDEAKHPLPGPWTPVRTAVSGADGGVRVRVDDLRDQYDWLLVEAEGYGPRMKMRLPRTVRLFRGFDVTVEVRNPLGRAAARASVGLIMGCGHTPDIRHVTTDDAGRATLPCVARDGVRDLWIVKPGLLSDYERLAEWRAGAAPQVVRCAPAPVIEGTVLDHEGRPAVGVFVGSPHCHRGPWARTGADGTFALAGAPRDSELEIRMPDSREPVMWCTAPPSGTRVLLRLPEPGTESDPGPFVRVRIRVEDDRGEPAREVSVLATRALDGFTARGRADGLGELTLVLPEGGYELVADGRLGDYGRKTQALRVKGTREATKEEEEEEEEEEEDFEEETPDEMAEEVLIRVPRNPRVRVTAQGDPGEHGSILLSTLTHQRDVTMQVLAGEPVCVPQSEDAVFWIERNGVGRAVELPRDARNEDAPPIVLAWPRPAVARVRLADDQGRPVRGWAALLPGPFADPEALAALREKPASAELEVTATWAGAGFLFALPEEPGLAPLLRTPVRIPDRTDVSLDLGRIVFERGEPRSLRVLGPEGAPAAGAVQVFREGGQARAILRADGSVDPLFAAQLRDGDRVLVEVRVAGPPEVLPLVVALAAPAPWTIRVPLGELRITAQDAAGEPVEDFVVVFAGEDEFDDQDGQVHLLGVPAGPHRLVVSAAGTRPHVVDVTLPDGGRREVLVTLEKMQPGK